MKWLKTFSLLIILSTLVVVAGGLAGGGGRPENIVNPLLFVALVFAFFMNFFAFWFSDKMALRMAGAKEVSEAEDPRLHFMVSEVARLANLPKPRVFVMQNDSPNAFATGRNAKKAVVAVTTGLRRILSEQELRGVLAHEMAHVKNRDMLIMTMVAVMAGVISFLGTIAMWSMLFGGFGRGGRGGGGGGYGAIIGIVGLLVLIIVMPMVAGIVRFAISRTREYAADETGARIIRDPNALASALEKLENSVRARPMPATKPTESMAHMFIVNPLGAASSHRGETASQFVGLFSTHPPMEERVRRLREMVLY